jgi:heme/copper-type cytochrome/quinol oxidase subunit 2
VNWFYVLVFAAALVVVALVLLGLAIFSVAKRSDSEWRRQHGCERRR